MQSVPFPFRDLTPRRISAAGLFASLPFHYPSIRHFSVTNRFAALRFPYQTIPTTSIPWLHISDRRRHFAFLYFCRCITLQIVSVAMPIRCVSSRFGSGLFRGFFVNDTIRFRSLPRPVLSIPFHDFAQRVYTYPRRCHTVPHFTFPCTLFHCLSMHFDSVAVHGNSVRLRRASSLLLSYPQHNGSNQCRRLTIQFDPLQVHCYAYLVNAVTVHCVPQQSDTFLRKPLPRQHSSIPFPRVSNPFISVTHPYIPYLFPRSTFPIYSVADRYDSSPFHRAGFHFCSYAPSRSVTLYSAPPTAMIPTGTRTFGESPQAIPNRIISRPKLFNAFIVPPPSVSRTLPSIPGVP